MTDLPMLQACLEANPNGVYTIWVTTSDELRQTVIIFNRDFFILLYLGPHAMRALQ